MSLQTNAKVVDSGWRETIKIVVHALILAIQDEELSHLHHAAERTAIAGVWPRALGGFISWSTDVAIWLSTWGDSTRMSRELAAARGSSR